MQRIVKVILGALNSRIRGWLDDALKLSVRAAPEQNKANAAVIDLIAQALHMPQWQVTITRGHRQACKMVTIAALDPDEARARLRRIV